MKIRKGKARRQCGGREERKEGRVRKERERR